MKPPSLPLYKKPETKSRQRTDVWLVVPTVHGDFYIASNKMTAAKPGEYEPSLDPSDSQWAAYQSELGPRAEKPWAVDEAHGGVDLTHKPTLEELDRAMALKTVTLSKSSLQPLLSVDAHATSASAKSPESSASSATQGMRGAKKLRMKDIRSAGLSCGSDNVQRGSTAASFEDRVFSLGVKHNVEVNGGIDSWLVNYDNRPKTDFPAGAMLPGDLYLDRKLTTRAQTMEHNKTGMPGAPIHPMRNDEVFHGSSVQSELRSQGYSHKIPNTLPDPSRIGSSFDLTNRMSVKATVNGVLGCHVLYDPRHHSADSRFVVRSSLSRLSKHVRSRAVHHTTLPIHLVLIACVLICVFANIFVHSRATSCQGVPTRFHTEQIAWNRWHSLALILKL
jgi:hypothetical protein